MGRDNRKELKRDDKHDTDVGVNRLKVPFSLNKKGFLLKPSEMNRESFRKYTFWIKMGVLNQ